MLKGERIDMSDSDEHGDTFVKSVYFTVDMRKLEGIHRFTNLSWERGNETGSGEMWNKLI